MNQLDLTEVVGDKLTASGVLPITKGHVICAQLRDQLRNLLRASDPAAYEQYRAIKYPEGDESDTPETRLVATRFLFDSARDLLLPFYVSSKP